MDEPVSGDFEEVRLADLHVSEELARRLRRWRAEWALGFDADAGWVSATARDAWFAEGRLLTDALTKELLDAFEVVPLFEAMYGQVGRQS